ncbi:hypothetical protein CA603_50910 [Paraburkholderia hospita]|nr:hypothetical protein CA603_50910 [Paraburkholderia hospita]
MVETGNFAFNCFPRPFLPSRTKSEHAGNLSAPLAVLLWTTSSGGEVLPPRQDGIAGRLRITDVSKSPDEYLGLPAGFLQAGAPARVSSLWAVDDGSTALLTSRFHKNHSRGR